MQLIIKYQAMQIRVIFYLLITIFVASCGIHYKPDIQQGNVITKEMTDKLKIGMTQNQVRFVLGSPLITDPFHKQRWDYYYSYKDNNSNKTTVKRLIIHFKDGKLHEIKQSPDKVSQQPMIELQPKIYRKNSAVKPKELGQR